MESRKRRSRFRFKNGGNPAQQNLHLSQNAVSRHQHLMSHGSNVHGTSIQSDDLMEQVCDDLQSKSDDENGFAEEPIDCDRQKDDEGEFLMEDATDVLPCAREESAGGTAEGEMHERAVSLKIGNWRVLWGLLMTAGGGKLTKFQYQAMRMVADAFHCLRFPGSSTWRTVDLESTDSDYVGGVISCLPHYTTLSTKFKSLLFESLTVRSTDRLAYVDMSKAGARATMFASDGTPQATVRTVLPSEYARADMGNRAVFDAMKSTSLADCKLSDAKRKTPSICCEECCDIWPIVSAREFFFGLPSCISVDASDDTEGRVGISFAEVGDQIQVRILGRERLVPGIGRPFKKGQTSEGYITLRGEIVAIWAVHHSSRRSSSEFQPSCLPSLQERDRRIVKRFGFVDYTSPSDSITVEIPEIAAESNEEEEDFELARIGIRASKKKKPSASMAEAIRVRKAASRLRREQVQKAWLDWVKPVVKPGDTVTMLAPCESEMNVGESRARLFAVHRFWTENEERGRHVFWVPGDVDVEPVVESTNWKAPDELCRPFDEDSEDLFREVAECTLWKAHEGCRGPEKFQPISSIGRLDSGELYFVYRFLLYWDGFEVSKGKSSSGEGFYLMCLNLPSQARANSNAVRIISLSPPGVKGSSVFSCVQADIFKGMTEGFVDFDAYGNRRRIFLDLVGFLGDTPAINASLDTLGHTSNVCCHLCKFTRHSSALFGSRYTGKRHSSLKTTSSRGFYQHLAIRDCNAKKESCRLLGMKETTEWDALPLHLLRRTMIDAKPLIPTTSGGIPVVSGALDPYKSCYVAPDHLLTGHLRDCINLVVRLLPSKEYRQACEDFIIGFLRDCNLPIQNRIFDKEKKVLYSMSMTELYSLSVVAEHGFIKGCEKMLLLPDNKQNVSASCMEAIALVGSASKLIAALWRLPTLENDAPSSLAAFDAENGRTWLCRLQIKVQKHIDSITAICSMADEDFLALQDTSSSRMRRNELLKERNKCNLAVRCLDKPNVHRLLELVYGTLPMVGHISRVGELALEKAHQSLKRAIQNSNNKEVQLQSMNTVIFNDWQGRLTLVAQDALLGDQRAVLGCYRLLAGRESVANSQGNVRELHSVLVKRALGPKSLVPSFLNTSGRSVISAKVSSECGGPSSWALEGDVESCDITQLPSTENRVLAFETVHDSGICGDVPSPIDFGNRIRGSSKNRGRISSLDVGDFVEIVVYRPQDKLFHIPLVVQRRNVGNEMHGVHEGTSTWVIIALLRRKLERTNDEFWAALRPCNRTPTVPSSRDILRNDKLFHIGDSISLVEVSHSLRKIGVLHDCESDLCTPCRQRAEIAHEPTPSFYLRSRKDGYPPRQG